MIYHLSGLNGILLPPRKGKPTGSKLEPRPSSTETLGGFLVVRQKPAGLRNLENQFSSGRRSCVSSPLAEGTCGCTDIYRWLCIKAHSASRFPQSQLKVLVVHTFQSLSISLLALPFAWLFTLLITMPTVYFHLRPHTPFSC